MRLIIINLCIGTKFALVEDGDAHFYEKGGAVCVIKVIRWYLG